MGQIPGPSGAWGEGVDGGGSGCRREKGQQPCCTPVNGRIVFFLFFGEQPSSPHLEAEMKAGRNAFSEMS